MSFNAASDHVIFALACSADRSGLHIHRVSGSGCLKKVCEALRSFPKVSDQFYTAAPPAAGFVGPAFLDSMIKLRHAHYLQLESASGKVIDDVIVTFYKGPSSYTGEDSVEIISHGNPLIDAQIQTRLRELGFSDAKPGEFTQRAYLNGKLDLTQAEAIAALIEADTLGGLELARESSGGAIQAEVAQIRTDLLSLRAQLEARIDFSEDEVGEAPWELIASLCCRIQEQLRVLEASYERGKKIREGLRISLVGAPNAGKSSLYNALLAEDAAIVSDEMGTTRDVLREHFVLQQRDFILSDTAGIRNFEETSGRIEQLGIERTCREMKNADAVLVVFDAAKYQCSDLPNNEQHEWKQLWLDFESLKERLTPESGQEILVVLNKTDLVPAHTATAMQKYFAQRNTLAVCTSSQNIDHLEAELCKIYDRCLLGLKQAEGARAPELQARKPRATLLSTRQRDHVRRSRSHIENASQLCKERAYLEILASEVIACEEALFDLLGRVNIEEVFGEIFSNFCIGK